MKFHNPSLALRLAQKRSMLSASRSARLTNSVWGHCAARALTVARLVSHVRLSFLPDVQRLALEFLALLRRVAHPGLLGQQPNRHPLRRHRRILQQAVGPPVDHTYRADLLRSKSRRILLMLRICKHCLQRNVTALASQAYIDVQV
jgi:hypothetical protein